MESIGGHLHKAGIDVTLVARGEHLAALQQRGLRLETRAGSEQLDVLAVGGAAQVGWSDDTVVLLSVKSQQTAVALDALAAHAPAGTPVVSLQNGVANEQAVLRRFGTSTHLRDAAHRRPRARRGGAERSPMHGILDIGRYPARIDDLRRAIAADLAAPASSRCRGPTSWRGSTEAR